MSSDAATDDRLGGGLSGADGDGTPVEQKLADLKRRKLRRRALTTVGLVLTGVLFYVSLGVVGFSLRELFVQIPHFVDALGGYFPPTTYYGVPFVDVGQYWAFIQEQNLIAAAGVTMAIAFAGTILGLPGALFFGVLASERVVPYPFNFFFRSVMTIIRSIPALVWVLILIPLGGVTSFTATLAIMIDTTGYLGRLFTDELEEIADGPIEGIRSVGANKSQIVSFGMLSQVFRQFIAWLAFDLEHNVRVAIGLGIIGAGGLGLELNIQRRTFNYTEMMACILLVVLLAGSVELLSQRVRSYMRDDEVEHRGVLETLVGVPRKIAESAAGRRS